MEHSLKDFEKFKNCRKYLPRIGDGDSKGTQAATAISKLVYKWFNDGDVFDNTFGLEGWANDISGSANWLYEYVEGTKEVLDDIARISTEDEYTELLYELCEVVDTQIPNLLNEPKEGDAYDEPGPFKFREESEYDDYDDYDF